MSRSAPPPLVALGLTSLEAEIYCFLVENSPATGYGIAKGIGKPAANTYKALESLHAKGAIVIEDSETRLCRAVAADELLESFERHFVRLKRQAQTQLGRLSPSPSDKRVYQLQTSELVIARYRKMFAESKRVVMLDFFPFPLAELRGNIVSAAKRGVKITMKAYEPCKIPGVSVTVDPNAEAILKKWPGQWANGVFDGEQYLLAFLSKDGHQVRQAIWSNNQYLSWIYYQGFVHELLVSELEAALDKGADIAALKRIRSKYRKRANIKATGYKDSAIFFD